MEHSIPRLASRLVDEADAYEFLEELRWAGKPVCPHCGNDDKCYYLVPKDTEGRKTRTGSRSERRVWKCAKCRKQFSAVTGTIMHGTKIPIRTWVLVIFEMSASKNGISSREIERKYDVQPRTAWFMLHRIREAMKAEADLDFLVGEVEVDETYYGGKLRRHGRKGTGTGPVSNKVPIVTLISRETGEARSQAIERVTAESLTAVVRQHVSKDAVLMTDGHKGYLGVGSELAEHHRVNHDVGEYARTTANGRRAGINRTEGFFGQLKRSIEGTHHFVSTDHLHRYLAEFDFRYNTRTMTDTARMQRVIDQAAGRRLLYR